MAAETKAVLLKLGPFKGVDYTSADLLLSAEDEKNDAGLAQNAINANATRNPGALMTERGRILAFDMAAVMTLITNVRAVTTINDAPLYLVQGMNGGATVSYYYDPVNRVILGPIVGLSAFNDAIQFGAVVYTNAGQRLFLDAYPSGVSPGTGRLIAYQWGYPSFFWTGSLTPTTGGALAPATYFYVFTRATTMPDGTVSETSVNPTQFASPATATVVGPNNAITLNNTIAWSGTNPDGTAYATNVYRQSTLQAGYFFVVQLTGGVGVPYTDVQSDASILSNPAVVVHRDQPPVVPGTNTGNAGPNLGYLGIHKNRVFVLVTVQNSNTLGQPQVQAWYSNLGRGWEFNSATQVMLLQSDVTATAPSGVVNYQGIYGNEPVGLGEVGTLLLAIKNRETWAVYGDDPSTFIQRNIFNIGGVSGASITPFLGGIGWLTHNGAYFFDGSSPQYNAEKIRDYLRPIPGPGIVGNSGVTIAAQMQAIGFFSNFIWYLAFPTIGQMIGYNTVTGEWGAIIPYAPNTASACDYHPWSPSYFGGPEWNEVIAGVGTQLQWFVADGSNDLGQPQTFSWQGPWSDSQRSGFQKKYTHITLSVPPGTQGSAVVTLQVGTQAPVVWTIPDLSLKSRFITTIADSFGGDVLGHTANLSLSVTGAAGQPAPQIWGVTVYGDYKTNLDIQT